MEPELSRWWSTKTADEHFSRRAEEKVRAARQQAAIMAAAKGGRTLRHMIHAGLVQPENDALTALKREREMILKQYDAHAEKNMTTLLAASEKRDADNLQRSRQNKMAYKKDIGDQIRQKEEILEKQKQEEMKDSDGQQLLSQKHVDAIKKQAELIAEKKKRNLMQLRQDIANKQLRWEMEKKRQKAEEEKIRRIQQEMEQRRRQTQANDLVRRRQQRTEMVSRTLEAIQQQQAAMLALREKKNEAAVKELQQEDKKGQEAAKLKGLTEYWELQKKKKEDNKVKEMKREEELIEAQKKWDLMSGMREKEKAEKKRENEITVRDANMAMIAQKRASAEQTRKGDQQAAAKTTREAAEKDRKLRQAIQRDLLLAAGFQDCIPEILGKSTGGPGLLLDTMDDGYNCLTTNEPLPMTSTVQTRRIRQYHDRNSLSRCRGQRSNLPSSPLECMGHGLLRREDKEPIGFPLIHARSYQEWTATANPLPRFYTQRPAE